MLPPPPQIVDLYSGCGGLSLGFEQAGFVPVKAYDSWDIAVENYNHLITPAGGKSNVAECHDLSNVCETVSKIQELDVPISGVIGGPPCQDFSSAGTRNEGERADQTINFAHVVSEIQPDFFVMENVSLAKKSQAFNSARTIFANNGYKLVIKNLNAALCGVPQNRRRLFTIGVREDQTILSTSVESFLDNNLSNKPMSVRDANISSIDCDYYYRHPRSYERRGIFSIDEPSPTIRGVNRPMPKTYRHHEGNPVLPTYPGLRALTYDERAQIQTFPASHGWLGSKTQIEQIIGNAVPVNLSRYVALAIKTALYPNG